MYVSSFLPSPPAKKKTPQNTKIPLSPFGESAEETRYEKSAPDRCAKISPQLSSERERKKDAFAIMIQEAERALFRLVG
jgi:hypothetical protein